MCFLPVLNVLVKPVSCANNPTFVLNSEVLCWSTASIPFVICAFLGWLLFYPAAVYLVPAWQHLQEGLDIYYKSSFLIISYQMKFVLTIVASFTITLPSVYIGTVVIICTGLLLLQLKFSPCNLPTINFWKTAFYTAVVWADIVAVVSICITKYIPNASPEISLIPVFLIYPGWFLILIISVILFFHKFNMEMKNRRTSKLKELVQRATTPSAAESSNSEVNKTQTTMNSANVYGTPMDSISNDEGDNEGLTRTTKSFGTDL